MRLFMASLLTETNTFSPIPTGLAGFREQHNYYRHDGSRQPGSSCNLPVIEWRRLAERDGHEIAESISASAQPAGLTVRGVYEGMRADILADLRAAMPVDAVLLYMHGAMVADGYDDCEGDVLTHVRAIVGPDVPVGIELDLHCHLTPEIEAAANVVITYKEYPHTDIVDRGLELYDLVTRAARGEIHPVTAIVDCHMLATLRTPQEPAAGLVRRMTALEGQDGILSVSLGHGFPWADVPEVGVKTVVVADGDAAKARALATTLAREVWDLREAFAVPHLAIDDAIDRILAAPKGPVVLADVADNAGGGAPSDSTFVLRRLIERDIAGIVSGLYWDPVAVGFCLDAGVGATTGLRLGGKCGPVSGDPLDLKVTIRAVSRDHSEGGLGGGRAWLGASAWVSVAVEGGVIDLVLVSNRTQVFHPDGFTGLGLTLADKRGIVVKSMQHFHAGFAPLASGIHYLGTHGTTVGTGFERLPYTKVTRKLWPKHQDAFPH